MQVGVSYWPTSWYPKQLTFEIFGTRGSIYFIIRMVYDILDFSLVQILYATNIYTYLLIYIYIYIGNTI